MALPIVIISFIIWAIIWSTILCYIDNFFTQENWIKGRSTCDHCKKQLQIIDLIPVLSYIWNKWKCRYCNKDISIKYPISEITFGIVRAIITWFQLYQSDYNSYDNISNIYNIIRRLTNSIWISTLALSDIRYRLVDTRVVAVWVVTNVLLLIVWYLYNDMNINWISLIWTMLIYIWWWCMIYLLGKLIYKWKYDNIWEWFGSWDIRVMWYIATIMYFVWQSWQSDYIQVIVYYMIWIVISCIFGILYHVLFIKSKNDKIPFVPCMLLAMIIMSIWSERFYRLYQVYFGL